MTTFSGTVYGSFQNPGLADSFVRVLGCDDGSVVVAWGNALEFAGEGDEIALAGCGDCDNGYKVFTDLVNPGNYIAEGDAGDYIAKAFFVTLAACDWNFLSNGDVFAGLCYVGSIGDDGTLNLSDDLQMCGLQWDAMTKLARDACNEQRGEWDPEQVASMCFYYADKLCGMEEAKS